MPSPSVHIGNQKSDNQKQRNGEGIGHESEHAEKEAADGIAYSPSLSNIGNK